MTSARFGSLVARHPVALTHDPADLGEGFWVVVLTFEGQLTAVRMAEVTDLALLSAQERQRRREEDPRTWTDLGGEWRTSLHEAAYTSGVAEIRERIAAGTVYQVNLCRILEHDLPEGASLTTLATRLARGNPAPYAAMIDLPDHGLEIACASPEAYLVRSGNRLLSRPIKGTAATREGLLPKDYAENVMIVDLVRNDIAHVCVPGTVSVEHLCALDPHPGLVHLTSDVSGVLRPGVDWAAILRATFPPGSVSGAPKHTALGTIADLEPVARGPYCGAIGWIDADRGDASLAVGIRTFWADRDDVGRRVLRFGTGAGITWGSEARGEWMETELKASRLIGLASGKV